MAEAAADQSDSETLNPEPRPEEESANKDTNDPVDRCVAVRELAKKLKMEQFWPGKLSFSILVTLQLPKELQETQAVTMESLAMTVYREIMAYNRTARETQVKFGDENDKEDDLFEEDGGANSSSDINPMDILHVCFLCCDPEVQQILCKTLFACKLAFPLIYTDSKGRLTLSQWSLRDIVVEYRDSQGQHVETSLVSDHPFPIVCFTRIGDIGASKSKLLNSLLGAQSHNTFLHRDCIGGNAERQCTNGLVEATVFLPSESQSSQFSRAFVLGNLRGDFLDERREAEAVAEFANILVIMVEIDTLQSPEVMQVIQKLPSRLKLMIIVFKREGKRAVKKTASFDQKWLQERAIVTQAYKGASSKNEAQLLADISKKMESLVTEAVGIRLDNVILHNYAANDETKIVLQGKASGVLVAGHIARSGASPFKTTHLPLQGVWTEYSQLHKEENSCKPERVELHELQKRKAKKREDQLALCSSPLPFLKDFVGNLHGAFSRSVCGLPTKIYIQWVKLLLDEISRKNLPGLNGERIRLRGLLQKHSQAAGQQTDDCASKKAEVLCLESSLQQLEKQTVDTSIGLENIFREIGQFYEATTGHPESSLLSTLPNASLPEMFARLLMWGIPLEILDGDASNIPLTWVTSVLDQCQKIVGDKRIIFISVLGLQSSGKSTLLNTMFGLKFAVSAGRCTRGAFLQVVPVESGMPFDYVAVIDTEGLRAPELGLDKHRHDNELATLVVGLGDITVINLKGENSAEMKDILQIVVHAFIRMKMANSMRDLRRRCIFVYQNVPAVGAKEKMMDANFKMQEDLDAITKEAAESENLSSVNCFSDIISFRSDRDVFYMSDLWLGNPPMAPVNPEYSHKVQEVKRHVLKCLDSEQKSFLGFSDFALRIQDMWKAIMSEDFVFSFRNSIEMKAYNQLEAEFFDIKRQCGAELNEWLTRQASIRVKKCITSDSVHTEEQRLLDELNQRLDEAEEIGIKRLVRFFDENRYSEYIIQWKSGKENSLRMFVRSFGQDIKTKLFHLRDLQLLKTQQKQQQGSWERDILNEAKRVANTMSKGCSQQEIEEIFEKLWTAFVKDLPQEKLKKRDSVLSKIRSLLRDVYVKDRNVISRYMKALNFTENMPFEQPASLTMQQLFGNDENVLFSLFGDALRSFADKTIFFFSGGEHSEHFEKKARGKAQKDLLAISNRILDQVKVEVSDISKQNRWFEENDAFRVITIVRDNLRKELTNAAYYTTTPTFEIKLVILALQFAYPHFVSFDSRFCESCSIHTKIVQIKERVRNLFLNIVQKQSSAKIAADYFRDHMKKTIKEAVDQRMNDKLERHIVKEIGNGKFYLICRMLDDFASKRDFAEIILYGRNAEISALKWLQGFIPDFLCRSLMPGGETRMISVVKTELIEPIFTEVLQCTDEACHSSDSLTMWIIKFCKCVESELAVLPQDLENLYGGEGLNEESVSLKDFVEFFRQGLHCAKTQMEGEYEEMEFDQLDGTTQEYTLCRSVLNSFWGCRSQCPFCHEPCSKDDADHHDREGTPHTCIQHKPHAVCGVPNYTTEQLVFRNCEYCLGDNWLFSCGFCLAYGRKVKAICAKNGNEVSHFHSYKKYKKIFPDWDIKPDASNTESKFWMWFCAQFSKDLGEYFEKPVDDLPPQWNDVTEWEALESLRSLRC